MASGDKKIQSHRDLVVWQESMNLAVAAYKLTREFPKDELYGLTSQIRRSSASVPANIAEGYGRESPGSYVQQLRVAPVWRPAIADQKLRQARRRQLRDKRHTKPLTLLVSLLHRKYRSNVRQTGRYLRCGTLGSLKELETYLVLASRVDVVSMAVVAPLLDGADAVGKMLRSLIRAIEEKR